MKKEKQFAMTMMALVAALFVLSACSNNVANTKLGFLNELERNKVNFSEQEKIERIIAFYKKKLAGIKDVEISFVQKIEANKDLEFDAFIFDFNINGEKQREMLFIKDNFFFSDFASIETLNTSKEKATKILEKEANANILTALNDDENYIITLGSGKKEVFIFTDPLCPFCREHLKGINERYLKNHKVHFIFVSVHGEAGFKRASLIYENINQAKNDFEKLQLIKLYYGDNINQEPTFRKTILDVQMLSDKYLHFGVKYVPYVIEK